MFTIGGASAGVLTVGGCTLGIPLIFLLVMPPIMFAGAVATAYGAALGVSCMSAIVNIMQNLTFGTSLLVHTMLGG
jgi:mannose/fructose/N-acetylgalactosamine-specific phosphotransferase system component IID